jgi:hypothetical protein
MALSEPLLKAHALRAYEHGRVLRALLRAVALLPVFWIAWLAPHASSLLLVPAVPLMGSVIALSIRGRSAGRAVPFALSMGFVSLLLPLAVRALGHACDSTACASLCLPACVLGGAITGGALAFFARSEPSISDRREFLLASLFLAALPGALGCAVAGGAGIVGMIAAEILVSAPAWREANYS